MARAKSLISTPVKHYLYHWAIVVLLLVGWLCGFTDPAFPSLQWEIYWKGWGCPILSDGVGTASPGRQTLHTWILQSEESTGPHVLTLWASALIATFLWLLTCFLNESSLGLSIFLWTLCFWYALLLCCIESLREFKCWDILNAIEVKTLR